MSSTKSLGSFDAIDLFDLLRDGTSYTLSELAELTGRARSTVAPRLEDLENAGLVAALPPQRSSAGRPPLRVAFDPSGWYVVAADVGLSHGKVALVDLGGAVLADKDFDADVTVGPEHVLDGIIVAARELIETSKLSETRLAAVGVGLPLPVIHDTGMPVNPTNLPEWDGFDVPGYLGRAFPVPVLVENDANIMALGESQLWPDAQDMIVLKASTGIGSGIINSGSLLRGAKGTAGAIGHVPVARGAGVPCICGNEGCLVALAGAPALARALNERGVDVTDVDGVVELARAGDLNAIRVLRQAGNDIGEVLVTCVSMFNPSMIAVGGRLAAAGDHLLSGIKQVLYNRAAPFATDGLQVVRSADIERAGIKGAGLLASEYALSRVNLERMLNSPLKESA